MKKIKEFGEFVNEGLGSNIKNFFNPSVENLIEKIERLSVKMMDILSDPDDFIETDPYLTCLDYALEILTHLKTIKEKGVENAESVITDNLTSLADYLPEIIINCKKVQSKYEQEQITRVIDMYNDLAAEYGIEEYI